MTIALSLIFIAFAILQIVLFFKIWIMTNDVREIKNKFSEKDLYYYVLKGDRKELEAFLDDKTYKELSYLCHRYIRFNADDNEYIDKYNYYKELYDRLELAFPPSLEMFEHPLKLYEYTTEKKEVDKENQSSI